MIFIKCCFLPSCKCIDVCEEFVESDVLKRMIISRTGLPSDAFSLSCNGRLLHSNETVSNGSYVCLTAALPGGKGGFGSMLRAIGAQIEKTTNREACRDLSGRRLRDINEEQRLKKWIVKQAEREAEAAKRKREKLERLRSAPKHEFNDSEYERKRSELPERIFDAVSQGLQSTSNAGANNHKRKAHTSNGASKKQCLWFGIDITSDLSDISDESDVECKGNDSAASSCASDSNTAYGEKCSDHSKMVEKQPPDSQNPCASHHSVGDVVSSISAKN